MVIHFRDGNPDLGRKVFQPELKAIAEKIARQTVNIFKKYIHLMREDSGAPSSADDTALFYWRTQQLEYANSNPLDFSWNGKKVSYSSVPRSEQDVIALFHQLVGIELLSGYDFISTSQYDKYDSCFRVAYDGQHRFAFDAKKCPLGVSQKHLSPKLSQPSVLEFKYDLDGLISDFEKEVKFDTDIDLVVCWSIGNLYKERYGIKSLLINDEGSSRKYFGSTHALDYERQKKFEIISIRDLLEFYRNPDSLLAEHKSSYRE